MTWVDLGNLVAFYGFCALLIGAIGAGFYFGLDVGDSK